MFFPVHLSVFKFFNILFYKAFEFSSQASENEHNSFGVKKKNLSIISIHFICLFPQQFKIYVRCAYACICVYVYAYVCVYIYIYMYIHIFQQRNLKIIIPNCNFFLTICFSDPFITTCEMHDSILLKEKSPGESKLGRFLLYYLECVQQAWLA